MTRSLSISRNGRFVALRQGDSVEVVDVLGLSPRSRIEIGPDAPFALVANELWTPRGDGQIWRRSLERDEAPAAIAGIDPLVSAILTLSGLPNPAAVVIGARATALVEAGPAAAVRDLGPTAATRWLPGHGRQLIAISGRHVQLRTVGRPEIVALPALDGDVVDGCAL